MRTLVFVCPITGHPVQSSLPEEAFKDLNTPVIGLKQLSNERKTRARKG
jgi:hypothetical protein